MFSAFIQYNIGIPSHSIHIIKLRGILTGKGEGKILSAHDINYA